mgnify:FL=1
MPVDTSKTPKTPSNSTAPPKRARNRAKKARIPVSFRIPDQFHQLPPKKSRPLDLTLNPYYQFLIRTPSNFPELSQDPSLLVPWEFVKKVRKLAVEGLTCPICLEKNMTAPRISRCGHVFCWPCALSLLNLAHSPKKCPLCTQTIVYKDLRSVQVKEVQRVSSGLWATFSLISREKSKLVLHRCGEDRLGGLVLDLLDSRSNHSNINRLSFYVDPVPDLLEEQQQLQSLKNKTEDTLTLTAIEKAQASVIKQISLNEGPNLELIKSECFCSETLHPVYMYTLKPCQKHKCPPLVVPKNYLPTETQPQVSSTTHLFFYQLQDGQPYFLHPLNVNMLLKHFGSFEAFPHSISGEIVNIEEKTVEPEEKRLV